MKDFTLEVFVYNLPCYEPWNNQGNNNKSVKLILDWIIDMDFDH